jgi:hypothetical protein
MPLTGILNLVNNLRELDTQKEVQTIIERNGARINELQQEQLAAGIGRSGRVRVDEYRPLTKLIKRERGVGLGAVTDRVTFFMQGNLYRSLRTVFRGTTFRTESPLPTFQKMLDRIGEDDYGLSPDQCEEFATGITIPEFGKVLEQRTGLKI